jgi:hypothetical protein
MLGFGGGKGKAEGDFSLIFAPTCFARTYHCDSLWIVRALFRKLAANAYK